MNTQTPHTKRKFTVHRRIALHTSSVMVLMGGMFLPLPFTTAGETVTLNVTARVAAPLPASPAVITSPSDQQHVSTKIIDVTGTCPAQSYVKVFNGSNLAGVSQCSGGSFSVSTTLAPGANTLTAKVYNITDDEGPASAPVTVFYDPPQPETPSGSPTVITPAPGSASTRLTLEIPFHYEVRKPGEQWQWPLTINGGAAPYSITVDWGDGTLEYITHTSNHPLILTHTFTQSGAYNPLIRVTDSQGATASMQLLAIVQAQSVFQIMRTFFAGIDPWLLWPAYIALLLAIGIFWTYEMTALRRHLVRSNTPRHRHV